MEVQHIHFDTIGSTSSWAKVHALELDPKKMTYIRADQQTDGYGRFQRSWVSRKGNLHLTIFFVLPSGHSALPNIGQILIFSLAEVLQKQGMHPQVKWPNDLLIEGKKIAGTIVEIVPMEASVGVVLGIGVNLLPVSTDQPTISLKEVSSRKWTPRDLTEQLAKQFQQNLHHLLEKGFVYFKEAFENLLAFKGEKISCQIGDRCIEGILDSLTKEGYLQIKLTNDKIFSTPTGDVQQLRKL